ncbi:MAG: hypothetical protein JWN47_1804, partial [Frankiales bacterium]|nr:hypothetical protein [Frankiales bacterium]
EQNHPEVPHLRGFRSADHDTREPLTVLPNSSYTERSTIYRDDEDPARPTKALASPHITRIVVRARVRYVDLAPVVA